MKNLSGEFDRAANCLQTPRDREGSFEPKIVAKRQVIITEGLDRTADAAEGDCLICNGPPWRGNSFRDISAHIKEIYGMELSDTQLSEITDKVCPLFTLPGKKS